MRRSLKRALIAVSGAVVAGAVTHVVAPEGLHGLFLNAIFVGETDTRWAPSYSWTAFRRVQVGDTQTDVVRVLGEPLEKREDLRDGKLVVYWMYTDSPTKSHFHMRRLLFDDAGRVIRKVSEFYVD